MINFKKMNKKPYFAVLWYSMAMGVNAESGTPSGDTSVTNNTRHEVLKRAIFEQPYQNLPYYKVTKALFKNGGERPNKHSESQLLRDAKRTLANSTDLLGPERGQKLLQANGICFSGKWRIDQRSEYTGLYQLNTQVPVIARASVSFSGTKQNERRALGLAVKLLPQGLGNSPSFNLFSLHSVGGVKTKYLLDLSLDNEPPLGRIPRFRDISTALKLKSVLLKADKESGSEKPSVTYRTIAPLASYREAKPIAPHWIRFSPANEVRIDRDDFRDELRVENYPNQRLIYRIEVGSNDRLKKSKAQWQTIGELVLTESVTSKACDTQLHFAHPKN